ncbi:HNH endonuclease [Streptomyces sp. NPDC002466]
MPANRPAIPRSLDRRIRVEAGHRCAIPTCHMPAPLLVIAHIRPWAEVKCHEFENLVALCPNCHTLFDRGHIDRKSMLQYKANLSPFSPLCLGHPSRPH